MIRVASRTDLAALTGLVIEFLRDTAYTNHILTPDIEHIKRLLYALVQVGTVWIYEVDGKACGLLAAVREPNLWQPNKISMRELVWYVKPEHRGTVSAGKLFFKYTQACEAMMKEGLIDGYFTARMPTTADVDLEARGFRLVEKLYLRD